MSVIGAWLERNPARMARRARGDGQILAAAATGVSTSTWQKAETDGGRPGRLPPEPTLRAIASYAGRDFHELCAEWETWLLARPKEATNDDWGDDGDAPQGVGSMPCSAKEEE